MGVEQLCISVTVGLGLSSGLLLGFIYLVLLKEHRQLVARRVIPAQRARARPRSAQNGCRTHLGLDTRELPNTNNPLDTRVYRDW